MQWYRMMWLCAWACTGILGLHGCTHKQNKPYRKELFNNLYRNTYWRKHWTEERESKTKKKEVRRTHSHFGFVILIYYLPCAFFFLDFGAMSADWFSCSSCSFSPLFHRKPSPDNSGCDVNEPPAKSYPLFTRCFAAPCFFFFRFSLYRLLTDFIFIFLLLKNY